MYYLDIKKTTTMGNGVFAAKNFVPDEILEICPAIPIPEKDAQLIQDTIAEYWLFEWKSWKESAMILGYGMIYNHSTSPNAKYTLNFSDNSVTFQAIKNIKQGEEIFIDYHQDNPSRELEMIDANTGEKIKYANK